MFYYILNIKMTSQSEKFDNDCDVIFMLKI